MDTDWSDKFEELIGNPVCDTEKNISITMAVLVIIIVTFGLFGNFIVFFVILILREYKKSVSNWYVLQLALADTLFLLMLPFTATEQLLGKWEFSDVLCKTKEGIIMVNYYASILFLTMMSFDRYMAVTKSGASPLVDMLRRLNSAALISLVIWIVSVCLAVPLYLYSHVDQCSQCSYYFPSTDLERCNQANINATECPEWLRKEDAAAGDEADYEQYAKELEDLTKNFLNITNALEDRLPSSEEACMFSPARRSFKIWIYLNFFVLLVLPLVLICAFYGLILRAMMGTSAVACTSQKQYRRRVSLMVLALVMLFAVSWVPWYAVMIARIPGITISSVGCMRLVKAVTVLSYMNSALNPYFYSFLGSRFHQRLIRARSKATRNSRFLSFLSRVYSSRHDSHSMSGSCKNAQPNNADMRIARIKSQSDDESYITKSHLRTERTLADMTLTVR